MFSFVATSSGSVAFFFSKQQPLDAANLGFLPISKMHGDFPSFSRCSSWLLGASPEDEVDSYCSLHSSPAILEHGGSRAVDMKPAEPYNLFQLDDSELLASQPRACIAWDGRTCLLTGCRIPCKGCAGPVAAYQSACQMQAWRRGSLITYAAVLRSEPTPNCPSVAPSPASEIVLEPHLNFVCCCMEAAAKLGKRATYAQVLACS